MILQNKSLGFTFYFSIQEIWYTETEFQFWKLVKNSRTNISDLYKEWYQSSDETYPANYNIQYLESFLHRNVGN